MPVTETPQTKCPKCSQWLDDHDGFGVLAHGKCGYCSHPSTIDGTCGICGALRGNPLAVKLQKGDTVAYTGGYHAVLDLVGDHFVKIDFKGVPKWVGRNEVEFCHRSAVYDRFRAMG